MSQQEWRIVVCENDLTPVSPSVIITEAVAGSIEGRRMLNGPGSLTLTLPEDHEQLDEITTARVLRFDQYDSELGGFVALGCFYPRRRRPVKRGPSGPAVRQVRWDCPGIAVDLDDTVVKSRNGSETPWGPRRYFDWRTPELSVTGWGAPHVRGLQSDKTLIPPDGYAGGPRSYPAPNARFLWSQAPVAGQDAPGYAIFHNTFTLATEKVVRAYPLGDDLYDLAIAGESIMRFNDPAGTGFQPDYRPLRLKAGTYTVRFMVQNRPRPGITNNSGAACLAIGYDSTAELYSATRRVENLALITSSSSSWKCLAVLDGDPMPGFTFGHRFRILFAESTGRGEIPGWTANCTNTVDAAGVSWPTSEGDSYDVLLSLADVLAQDVGRGWVEWVPRRNARTIDLYVEAGTYRPDAALEFGESITDLSEDEDLTPAVDGLTVGYQGGFVDVGSGPRRAGFQTDAETEQEAVRLGETELARLDPDRQLAVTLRIDPVDRDRTPGLGFDVGDTVDTPAGQLRCLAYGWKVQGRRITWIPEFSTIREELAERQARIARRQLPGSLGGRSESVAPTTPNQPDVQTLGTEVLTWSTDSSLEQELEPLALAVEGRVHHIRVIAGEHPPIGGDMEFWLNVNGTRYLGPMTLPQGPVLSGDDEIDALPQEWESEALAVYGGPNIHFSIEITQGSGHGRLTFEATAAPLPMGDTGTPATS